MWNRSVGLFLLGVGLLLGPKAWGQAEGLQPGRIEVRSPGRSLNLAQVSRRMIEETNQFRKQQNQSPVQANAKLTATAQDFANFMAETKKFSHNADDKQPADRAKGHGYDFCLVLENIAFQFNPQGFTTEQLARLIVDSWKESPGHRKNMLDPDVTETGVAVAQGKENGYFYAVQMFGRPGSLSVEFKVTNRSHATVQYQIGEQTFPLPPRMIRTHTGCRQVEIVFQVPEGGTGSGGETKKVRARKGDSFIVVDQGKGVRVKKE